VDLPVAPRLQPNEALPSARALAAVAEAEAQRRGTDHYEDSLDIPLKSEKTSISRVDVVAPIDSLDRRQKLAYLAFLLPVVVTGWGISWCNQVIATRPPSVTVSAGVAGGEAAVADLDSAKVPRGVVEILSNPPGAVLEVDGKVLANRTPTTLTDLRAEEEHRIALTLNNFEPWERRFRLGRNEKRTLQADLKRIEGTLEIVTRPAGVQVEIDGQPRGDTPIELPAMFIGEEQEVVLRKAGYRPVTKRVEWNGRRFVTLEVELRRSAGSAAASAAARPAKKSSRTRKSATRASKKRSAGGDSHGYLSVSAIPWGKVYVDRRIYAAETPVLRGQVPAGRHSVKVYYPTLKRFSKAQKVSVRAGETKKLFFRD
jgi:hypothetical protein